MVSYTAEFFEIVLRAYDIFPVVA